MNTSPSPAQRSAEAGKTRKKWIMTPYRRGRFNAVRGQFECPYVGCPAAAKQWRKGVRDVLAGRSKQSKRASVFLGAANYYK